ncbi:MAG: hypothetical protein HY811_08620 [Planctomycetes bacterium]|nr:hypothetical protein [Planctomycetota bacterium]
MVILIGCGGTVKPEVRVDKLETENQLPDIREYTAAHQGELIILLGSDDWETREKAKEELTKIGRLGNQGKGKRRIN